MNKLWCGLMIGLLVTFAAGAQEISGELETVNGFPVLRLWGTPSEMGYAHGYLMCEDIHNIVDNYVFWLLNAATYDTVVVPAFRQWMSVPEEFQTEMDAMIQGMQDSGCGVYSEKLGRDLTSEDIAIVNSIVDFVDFTKKMKPDALACSSICGWDDGTQDDADNPRGTIQCRDLDWVDTASHVLGKASLIIAYTPSTAGKVKWFSVAFPGFVSCLSGMNEFGTGATLDMGNHEVNPGTSSGHVPMCLQVRQALENADPNGDGSSNAEDVWFTLNSQSRVPSTIVHAFSPFKTPGSLAVPSLVVESNYSGIAKRIPTDDPNFGSFFIGVTNHHRVLYPPVACSRYATITNRIMADYRMDSAKAWSIENAVGGSYTIQTMLFRPELKDLSIAATVNNTPAPQKEPCYLQWDDIFTTSPNPTATPVLPTETPAAGTPTPSATPEVERYYVDLNLSESFFGPGDSFVLDYTLGNTFEESLSANLWIILDVQGSYWFYPRWVDSGDFDPVIVAGNSITDPVIILDFQWPDDITDHLSEIRFYGGMTNQENTELMGDFDMVTFGF